MKIPKFRPTKVKDEKRDIPVKGAKESLTTELTFPKNTEEMSQAELREKFKQIRKDQAEAFSDEEDEEEVIESVDNPMGKTREAMPISVKIDDMPFPDLRHIKNTEVREQLESLHDDVRSKLSEKLGGLRALGHAKLRLLQMGMDPLYETKKAYDRLEAELVYHESTRAGTIRLPTGRPAKYNAIMHAAVLNLYMKTLEMLMKYSYLEANQQAAMELAMAKFERDASENEDGEEGLVIEVVGSDFAQEVEIASKSGRSAADYQPVRAPEDDGAIDYGATVPGDRILEGRNFEPR